MSIFSKLFPNVFSNILLFIFTVPDEPVFVGGISENDYYDNIQDRMRIQLGYSWKVCLYYTLQYMLYACTCIKFGHSQCTIMYYFCSRTLSFNVNLSTYQNEQNWLSVVTHKL